MSDKQVVPNAVKDPELYQIMLQREQREAEEYTQRQADRAAAETAKKAKDNKRVLNDKRSAEKVIADQKVCSHLKGETAFKRPHKEFNIYAHQLPDGAVFIRCRNRCGMKWQQGDTREHLFRKGKKFPNHTGLSFDDMWRRLPEDSFSRSEMQLQTPVVTVASDSLSNDELVAA
jgi:hypothetical protein